MGTWKLARMIRSLSLIETINAVTSNDHPSSYVKVSKQVDGVCAYSNLSISEASFGPQHFAVGDHRVTMVKFNKKNLLGFDYLSKAPISMSTLMSSNSQVIWLYLVEAKKIYRITR